MTFDPGSQTELGEALAQIELDPTSPDNWNRAAIASLRMSNLEAAIDYIGHAIELNPQDALNYSNRGRILFALERPEIALVDYTKAIELAPDATLYSNRSVVNVALGRNAAALGDLNDAIDLEPTAENILNRAAFFANKSMPGDAFRDISKVIELQPNDPNHRLTRANLAFAIGFNEQGITDVREAIKLDQTGAIHSGLLQLADQLEAHLGDSPQPEVSRRLINLIRNDEQI